jgi:hypothetical protein
MLAKMWAVLKGPWLALFLDSKLVHGDIKSLFGMVVEFIFLKCFLFENILK